VAKFYPCTSLNSGAGSLKGLDGALLEDSDIALVGGDGNGGVYQLDADSGEDEISPYIIAPTAYPGTKRWIYKYDASITGPQGPQGYQGSQGGAGAQGAQGSQGPQGSAGDGTQGAQGPQGNQGSQGETGSQGNQGYQGPDGA